MGGSPLSRQTDSEYPLDDSSVATNGPHAVKVTPGRRNNLRGNESSFLRRGSATIRQQQMIIDKLILHRELDKKTYFNALERLLVSPGRRRRLQRQAQHLRGRAAQAA